MIPAGVQVFVAVEPVDMRYGFERLSGLVREVVGLDARCRALFVFMGKRRETIKVLFFDGTGICLFYKRLDRGTFKLPDDVPTDAKSVEIDELQLEVLLDGMQSVTEDSLKKPRGRPRTH